MNKKRHITKITVFITSIFVIFMSVTYAFITQVLTGEKQVVINAGVLDLVLEEEDEITISDALPMYDQVGMIQEDVFVFRLVNKTSNPTNYVLKLQEIEIGTLDKSIVKYGLIKEGEKTIDLVSNIMNDVIDEGRISGNDTINYELRLWIDSTVTDQTTISGKSLSYMLKVDASQKIVKEENKCLMAVNGEDTSGAEEPRLTSGMIPVVYDECENTWIKADTTESWYNYDTQNWANAVTVTEDTRDTYMAMGAGEPISMDDINTMWVWIPRYEYQYTDLGTSYAGGTQAQPGEIKVNFISSDTLIPSNSTKYQIPEGFKFGEENIPGFWMAKFETSTLESCTSANNSINTACDLTTLTPQIKPNVTSWRGARISTFFETSRLMQSSDNNLTYNADTYGFDVEGTSSMDIHMLKNTEWGIVAMLSQSKYGKYGNTSYVGAKKEVYQNKSSDYITGSSNKTPSQTEIYTQVAYDTKDTGYGASTTGTIYGAYDMSGGAAEYVMGNYLNYSGNTSYNSGFCGINGPTENCQEWPNAKYFDLYLDNYVSTGYKFGDATYETSGWYNDYASFVNSQHPWFIRGGYYNDGNLGCGIFVFSDSLAGQSYVDLGSRLAIKP